MIQLSEWLTRDTPPGGCEQRQGSILGPDGFNRFAHDLEEMTECAPIKPAGDTRLGGPVHMLEHRDATQKDLQRLERDDGNLMMFNKANDPQTGGQGRKNPWQRHRLGDDRVRSSSAEKDLGILLGRQQAALEPAVCPGSKEVQKAAWAVLTGL